MVSSTIESKLGNPLSRVISRSSILGFKQAEELHGGVFINPSPLSPKVQDKNLIIGPNGLIIFGNKQDSPSFCNTFAFKSDIFDCAIETIDVIFEILSKKGDILLSVIFNILPTLMIVFGHDWGR